MMYKIIVIFNDQFDSYRLGIVRNTVRSIGAIVVNIYSKHNVYE